MGRFPGILVACIQETRYKTREMRGDTVWSFPYDDSSPPIDDSLQKCFLWVSIGQAYNKQGHYRAENNLYESVMIKYETALRMRWNNLLWSYDGSGMIGRYK